jgi:ribonucleoside-diphosphate reductase alpha chain
MDNIVHGIKVDYSRDSMFSESGLSRLKEGYMIDGETSPQQRFAFVSKTFSSNAEHAQRLYDYSSKMWLSYSTPILSYGKTQRSLPISCFASYLGDSIRSILDTSSETRMLAVVGGGVGLHVALRPGDKKSSGIIPHLKTYDVDTLAFKQGTTRRGATAAYLDINHPEIVDFLEMRKPTGGDPNRKCLNLHHGVNITDDFMRRVEQLSLRGAELTKEQREQLDRFPLVNPNTGEVVEYASVRELWERILTIRMEQGEPYIWFIDTVNNHLPEFQKAKGLKNRGSNLCSEITLATDNDRTFVCCLSSVNLEKYDEWKDDPQFIPDIVEMLDNVITVFAEKARDFPELKRAINSALAERSIGIGAMGWHALLMSKMIAFESPMAVGLNKSIWSKIKQQATEKTIELAKQRGPCPDSAEGSVYDIVLDDDSAIEKYGFDVVSVNRDRVQQSVKVCDLVKGDTIELVDRGSSRFTTIKSITPKTPLVRNSHLLSVAPNASSSIILDTSPSIEPYRANVYLEKGVNGTRVHRNKYLEKLLETKQKNTAEVWTEITSNDGSVATLDFLTDYEKAVFKTSMEIDQTWVIQHAADRQPYICQAQSLNLFFDPTVNVEYLHLIHLMAWKQGLKSLYYCRSDAMRKADKVGKRVERERIEDMKDMLKSDEPVCLSCEG